MKRILVWLLTAFLLQFGIYEYLDRVILTPAAQFSQQTVGKEGQDTVPSVRYSYNRAYYSELFGHDLQIHASKGNRLVRDISLKDNETVSYFSWLPDRNLALAGISTEYTRSTTVTLLSIDPETDSQPVAPKITGLAKGARIESTAFSTQTNITNILVQDGVDEVVYRTDANNYLRRLSLGTWHIDRIASLRYQNTLLYDDSVTRAVYAYYANGHRAKLSFTGHQPYALIGTDQYDNVYLGELTNSNMVSVIVEGKINGVFSEVKQLDSPSPADSINVTYDGTLSVS